MWFRFIVVDPPRVPRLSSFAVLLPALRTPLESMQDTHLVIDPRDPEAIKQLARAITAWDPLLSVKFSRGESLYDGVKVCYGVSIGGPTTLAFRERRQAVEPGDVLVMPPSVRIAAAPAAEFFWVCHEGLAPEHLRGPAAIANGFEHFAKSAASESISHGSRQREVLPISDFRHRLHYRTVEFVLAEPVAPAEVVELCYVWSDGAFRIGPASDQLTAVPVQAGQVVAIGPGICREASAGLSFGVWRLFTEVAHRRRVRG